MAVVYDLHPILLKIIQRSINLLYFEVKEGISTEEFQKIIDGPYGPGFRINALMSICKSIDISLINGQSHYPRVSHKLLS